MSEYFGIESRGRGGIHRQAWIGFLLLPAVIILWAVRDPSEPAAQAVSSAAFQLGAVVMGILVAALAIATITPEPRRHLADSVYFCVALVACSLIAVTCFPPADQGSVMPVIVVNREASSTAPAGAGELVAGGAEVASAGAWLLLLTAIQIWLMVMVLIRLTFVVSSLSAPPTN
ncbi:MAG: hypothetical protein U0P45_14490 [Acidimicrobiales bacterium]